MPVNRSCPVRQRLGINRVRGGEGVERRDAHAARVWLPLGHSSWESYCAAEFGISRAQAYRLLDVARSLAAIHGAIAAGTQTSRETAPPGRRDRARLRPVPARPNRRLQP